MADAIGDEAFRRAPVTADLLLTGLEHGQRMHDPLVAPICRGPWTVGSDDAIVVRGRERDGIRWHPAECPPQFARGWGLTQRLA